MGAGQKQERSSRSKRAGKLKTRKLTMEQPSDPSAPHQVIYIVQAAKEKVNIKDAYNVKAATVLGIIHIIFGLISLGIEITNLVVDGNGNVATGIWTSVFFFISGGLAIGGARSGNKCLVVATLVMAIISAVSAGILLILSTILLVSSYRYSAMTALAFGLLIGTGGNDADHCHRLCLSHLQTSLLWIEQPRHRPLQPQPCQPGCDAQHNNSSRSPGPPFNFGPAFAEF